jgi:hypothetical protein
LPSLKSEPAQPQYCLFSVGLLGIFPMLANADAHTVIEPFLQHGCINYLWNQSCDQ